MLYWFRLAFCWVLLFCFFLIPKSVHHIHEIIYTPLLPLVLILNHSYLFFLLFFLPNHFQNAKVCDSFLLWHSFSRIGKAILIFFNNLLKQLFEWVHVINLYQASSNPCSFLQLSLFINPTLKSSSTLREFFLSFSFGVGVFPSKYKCSLELCHWKFSSFS